MSDQKKYEPLSEMEAQKGGAKQPQHWAAHKPGAGQCEFQGYDTWTPEEQEQFANGELREKWGCLQVSIRMPVRSCLTVIAILYGYLPFIIPIWWLIWVVATWIQLGVPRFFPLFGLCIAIVFGIVNETVTKQICKRVLPESITSRPPEAVCKHPGMPSGHVMNAYTLMIWILLECLTSSKGVFHAEWLVIIILFMGPVPWARVYNRDHTVKQVTASAIISLFMGSAAFLIRRNFFPHHANLWDWYYIEGARVFINKY